jgi:hypothetical protein
MLEPIELMPVRRCTIGESQTSVAHAVRTVMSNLPNMVIDEVLAQVLQCQTSDFPDGIGLCDFAPYISGNSEIMTESMMTLETQPLERWSVNSETASVRYIQDYLAADNIRHAVNFMRAMDCPPAATEGTGHVNIVYEKDRVRRYRPLTATLI